MTTHLDFVREQDCLVKGCREPAQAHHVRTAANSGIGMKPADVGNTCPLCARHHAEGHRIGWRSFERRYQVDLAAEAAFLGSAGPMP